MTPLIVALITMAILLWIVLGAAHEDAKTIRWQRTTIDGQREQIKALTEGHAFLDALDVRMTLLTGHLPPESLPCWADDGTPLHPQGLPVLVRIYDDGTAEVAVRDTTYGRWMLPAELKEEVSG